MVKRAKTPKIAHPLDAALGARIKDVRTAQSPRVSQLWLAQEVGCSVAQIQKYETGKTRVSFSRLCAISKALDIDVIALVRPVLPPRL